MDKLAKGQGDWPAPLNAAQRAVLWEEVWAQTGLTPRTGQLAWLESSWGEPPRTYHDRRHLGECLALWQMWKDQAQRPHEVAIALWFHDAEYDPAAPDNEKVSASWAVRALIAAGADSAMAQRVYEMVMATTHRGAAAGLDADTQLLLDIDLAILGSPPERFEQYDADVRREYADVPGHVYNSRRAQVLDGFLARPAIYHCQPAVRMLEAQARANLRAALSRLDL